MMVRWSGEGQMNFMWMSGEGEIVLTWHLSLRKGQDDDQVNVRWMSGDCILSLTLVDVKLVSPKHSSQVNIFPFVSIYLLRNKMWRKCWALRHYAPVLAHYRQCSIVGSTWSFSWNIYIGIPIMIMQLMLSSKILLYWVEKIDRTIISFSAHWAMLTRGGRGWWKLRTSRDYLTKQE